MTPKQTKKIKRKLILRIAELKAEVLEFKIIASKEDLEQAFTHERILRQYEERLEQL